MVAMIKCIGSNVTGRVEILQRWEETTCVCQASRH